MKKKLLYILAFLTLLVFSECKKSQSITGTDPPGNGGDSNGNNNQYIEVKWDGTIKEPILVNDNTYEIHKAEELAWISEKSNSGDVDSDFRYKIIKLMVNVDFENNENFKGIAIGGDESGNNRNTFKGIFDGNGKEIKNILIETNQYVGFIGHLEKGKIKNLGIKGGNIRGDWTVGGIVGNILSGTLENCYYTGVVKGGDYTGGLVGQNQGVIKNSYNLGNVYGIKDNTGGISGGNYGGTIEYCYNFGNVIGAGQVGGMIGDNNLGTLTNSFFLQIPLEVNDGKNAIGGGGGIGSADPKNYDQFKNQSTFSGWDFTNVWKMGLERPIFTWQ